MSNRRAIRVLFALILVAFTVGLSEVGFRVYDHFTAPPDNLNMDVWVKRVSLQLEEHPLLGYRRIPNQAVDERTQVDEFGMANVREALASDRADVVGIGDSYMEVAQPIFFDRFAAQGLKYHSLALFGYGPPNYDVLMNEYGAGLHPQVTVYATYLGNDPGDVRRYENWRASGKSWYAHNGGYVFPIERQGVFWGWRLFGARAKGYARSLISRVNPDSYASLRTLVKRDDAETIFQYVLQAKELAHQQGTHLLVVVIPRTPGNKPLLDPIATKLLNLCAANNIDSLDLDPAFGPVETRGKLFAPDEHWNEAEINEAWTYLWDRKLQALLSDQKLRP